jgi:hypothetical protein
MADKRKIRTIATNFGLEDVGSTLLEELAKGLYQPDEVIREYIQNAIDAHRIYKSKTGEDPEGPIQIEMRDNNITIYDYGIGMNQDEIQKVKSIGVSKKRNADIGLTGHKGVGIWAGLSFFESITIYSKTRGSKYAYQLKINFKNIVDGISDEKHIGEVLNPNHTIIQMETSDIDEHLTYVILENPLRNIEWFNDLENVAEAIRRICPCEINEDSFVFFQEVTDWRKQFDFEVFPIELNGNRIKKSFPSAVEKFETGSITINDKEVAVYWRALNKKSRKLNPDKHELVGFQLIQDGFALGGQNPYSGKQTGYPSIKLTANYLFWYIGEIHVLEDTLHPNLKRDGFEESEDSRRFIEQLRKWYEGLEKTTRIYSYVRDMEQEHKEYEALLQRLSEQPMLIKDNVDTSRLIEADRKLKEDEEIIQKQKSKRQDGTAVHPHEKEALTNKDLKVSRRKLIGRISTLKKHLGIIDSKIETDNLVPSEAPREAAAKTTSTSSMPSQYEENYEEDPNDEFPKDVKTEVFLSLLENVLEEEGIKANQRKIIMSKVQIRIDSVMQDG